jgi:hypothetical protein
MEELALLDLTEWSVPKFHDSYAKTPLYERTEPLRHPPQAFLFKKRFGIEQAAKSESPNARNRPSKDIPLNLANQGIFLAFLAQCTPLRKESSS